MLAIAGGDDQALVKMSSDKAEAFIPFQELCNAEGKKGDIEIHGVKWKAYRSERAFDDFFRAYWRNFAEKWKRGDREIGTVWQLDTQ